MDNNRNDAVLAYLLVGGVGAIARDMGHELLYHVSGVVMIWGFTSTMLYYGLDWWAERRRLGRVVRLLAALALAGWWLLLWQIGVDPHLR